jgi:hypothetical protein
VEKNKMPNGFPNLIRRTKFISYAIFIALAVLLPVLEQSVSAATYTQLTTRSIQLSDSSVSATGVSYNVNFTTSAAYTVNTVVIEICNLATGPFIAAACTTPDATFNWNKSTATIGTQVGITGLSIDATDSTANKLVLTRTAGVINGSIAATIPINGVTNPATLGTYYARIYTLNNATGNTAGTLQDAGGVALSTANNINLTTKVQESLIFCVYTTGSNCAGASGSSLALGDANGILTPASTTYTNTTVKFDIATNSSAATTITLKGDTLKSGSNSIAPSGVSCTVDTSPTEFFGLRVSTPGAGVTVQSPYNCSSGSHGLDTNGANGSTSPYGDPIATLSGPTNEVQSILEYAGKSSTTTKSGIYSSSQAFIATSSY